VYQLDTGEGGLCRVEGFEAQHRPGHPFHGSVILLHDIVKIFGLADGDSRPVLSVVTFDGRFVRRAAVNGDRLGDPAMSANGFGQESLCCGFVPLLRQQEVNRLAVFIDGPVQIFRWCPSLAWMKGRSSDIDRSRVEPGVKVGLP